jgi:tripartite-type tricarboxylate transporter receptor subunit TctC
LRRAPVKRMHWRAFALACIAFGVLAAPASPAADAYPLRPIRLIMPNAPGSSNDTLGRLLAARLAGELGQQIVVDNRAGAGGVLGTEIGAGAIADGYTLIVSSEGALSLAPHIYKKLSYDPLRDFEFVGVFADTPNLLVTNPTLPVKTAREFIDYAKAKAGQLNLASAGAGSQSHLTGYALMLAAGFNSLHVPYKGGAASINALVSNESQWSIPPAAGVMTLVRSARLRALAHTLPKRSPLMGELPALAETLPGFTRSGWKGLLAPRGTPRPIVDKLHAAMRRSLDTREAREQFAQQGSEVVLGDGAAMKRLLEKEIADTALVVKAAGLRVE